SSRSGTSRSRGKRAQCRAGGRYAMRNRLHALDITEERRLAGALAGALYLTGGITVIGLLLLPGSETRHWPIVVASSVIAIAWSLVCLFVIPWESVHPLVSHFSSFFGFPLVAVSMASTGGATSPARF